MDQKLKRKRMLFDFRLRAPLNIIVILFSIPLVAGKNKFHHSSGSSRARNNGRTSVILRAYCPNGPAQLHLCGLYVKTHIV